LPWGRRGVVEKIVAEDVRDVLGVGKRVILEVSDRNELRYKGAAKRLFTYALYKDNPALVCGFGIRTPNYLSLRLMVATPSDWKVEKTSAGYRQATPKRIRAALG
jgi:hypothetical protein